MRAVGGLFGFLVGLAFAGAGVYFLNEMSLRSLESWQAMQDWRPVRATLLSVDGSQNDTEATYVYRVDGRRYQNDRVSVAPFKDSLGSYHADLRQHLSRLHAAGRPIRVWYDPADPSRSVIDRDMRWGLFALATGFSSAFVLMGLLLCYASARASSETTPRNLPSKASVRHEWRQKKRLDPGFDESFLDYTRRRLHEARVEATSSKAGLAATPWLQRKEWQSNPIRSDARSSAVKMWIFAFVWNAVSSPILFMFPDEWSKGNYAALIGLLFPIVGLFLVYRAVQMTREWRRFGVIELDMDPYPGAIGGHVGGRLLVGRVRDVDCAYRVELQCVFSYVSGSGDDQSRRESIRWAEAGDAKVRATGSGVQLEFRFDVPEELPQADVEQTDDYYFWRLRVTAGLPGVDLNRDYNIPVFKTGERSRVVEHDISAQGKLDRERRAAEAQSAIDRGELNATDLARSLRFTETGKGVRLHFPMFRNKTLTIVLAVCAGACGFVTYHILKSFGGADLFGLVAVVLAVPFGLVALLTAAAAVYLALNNLSVRIARGELRALRRLFIVPLRYQRLAARHVEKLEIKRSGSTGQGTGRIEHFKLVAKPYRGRPITIAEDIDGEKLASQFKEFVWKKLKAGY